jgi:hypothetical protein
MPDGAGELFMSQLMRLRNQFVIATRISDPTTTSLVPHKGILWRIVNAFCESRKRQAELVLHRYRHLGQPAASGSEAVLTRSALSQLESGSVTISQALNHIDLRPS